MIADRPINGLYFAKIDGNKVVRMGEVSEISVETKYPSVDEMPDMSLIVPGRTFSATIELDKPLTPVEIAILTGMRVITLPKCLMAEPIGVEPVRRHKRKRIAKKWARRYGRKTVYGPERSFIKNDILFVGPDTYKEIREKVK